jgi:glycosyltransferase involved in cell wall biosynthesis
MTAAVGRIVVAGSVAQKAGNAGHTWQFLQYLLGFRRLGYEVLLLDSLEHVGVGPAASARERERVAYVEETMRAHDLDHAWTVALSDGRHAGMPRKQVLRFLRSADLLLNVMGFCTDAELLAPATRRVFLDTDPGFPQMWCDLGLADVFAGHDAHVTIAARIAEPDCEIPTCGLDWITTPQPVVLDAWPRASAPPRRPFTSVASWRGAYGPVDYAGKRYGLRVHEFRRFARLPALTGRAFELALAIHEEEASDLALLRDSGWTLVAPEEVATTPAGYRAFIAESTAELMVAKGMYVQARSGWFSERSICYLASGRPVVAQDTGLGDRYPLGAGLLAFDTLDQAAACVESIACDYGRHSKAARAIAETHFDSDRVLARLLERVDASAPRRARTAAPARAVEAVA